MTARPNAAVSALVGLMALASVGAGVLAGVSPKYALAAALGLVFLVVTLQEVTVGLCMLAAVALIDANGTLGVAKPAGAVLVLSWLATIMSRRSSRGTFVSNHQGLSYALVVIVAWMLISTEWAESSAQSLFEIERYIPSLLLIPIAYDAIQERRHAVWLLGTIAVCAAIAAVLGVLSPPPDPSSADAGRATGTFGDANEYAAALVAGIPLMLAFALRARSRLGTRILGGAAGIMTVGALFLTLSRGGLVAFGAILAASVVLAGRWRKRVIGAAAGLLAAGVGYFVFFASLPARERVSNVGGGTGRLDIWTIGERMVSAHPVRGIGVGNFPVSSVHYLLQPGLIKRTDFIISHPKAAHNTYLQLAAELGIPMALLFVGIMLFCVWCGVRAAQLFARREDVGLELLARASVVSVIGYLVAIVFISEMYSKLLWLLLGLGPALYALARNTPQVE